jgi:hypothetical protein
MSENQEEEEDQPEDQPEEQPEDQSDPDPDPDPEIDPLIKEYHDDLKKKLGKFYDKDEMEKIDIKTQILIMKNMLKVKSSKIKNPFPKAKPKKKKKKSKDTIKIYGNDFRYLSKI